MLFLSVRNLIDGESSAGTSADPSVSTGADPKWTLALARVRVRVRVRGLGLGLGLEG